MSIFKVAVVCLLLIGVFVWNGSVIGQVQEEPKINQIDKDFQRKVRLLQRKLNSDSLDDRNQAEAELIALGTKLLDYLPDANDNYEPDFNTRLKKIRAVIELKAEKEFSSPRPITLDGEFSLSDIAKAIENQSGNVVQVSPEVANKRVSLKWDKKLFWQAADDLCQKTGSELVLMSAGKATLIPARTKTKVDPNLLGYADGFRFAATHIQTSRDLKHGGLPRGQLSVSLRWEPRYRVIKVQVPFESLSATDAKGNESKMVAISKEGTINFGVSLEDFESEVPIPFSLNDVKNKEQRFDLKGTLKAVVSGRLETFVFQDLNSFKESKQIKKSGIDVKLMEVKKSDHLLAVSVDISLEDAKSSLESHLGWVYENPAFLIHKDGQKLNFVGTESGGQNENRIRVIYLFENPKSLEGWSLKYQCPGILIEKKVPFHIKGVLLPF